MMRVNVGKKKCSYWCIYPVVPQEREYMVLCSKFRKDRVRLNVRFYDFIQKIDLIVHLNVLLAVIFLDKFPDVNFCCFSFHLNIFFSP